MASELTISERRAAEKFSDWISSTSGESAVLTDGEDPPDFLLDWGQARTWLEVTDIYYSQEQARFLNSDEQRFRFKGPIDETANRLVSQLDQKLSKDSYSQVFGKRGPGFLLLTCRDFLLDEVNLACIDERLKFYTPSGDKGFFKAAYFSYGLSQGPITYLRVYSRIPSHED